MRDFIQIKGLVLLINPDKLKRKIFCFSLIVSVFFMPIKYAYSLESYDKYWSVVTISGSLSEHKRVKYYLESQQRFIDNPYVFNQFFLLAGLGYQLKRDVTFYMGPGLIIIKNNEGVLSEERRLWQQINWLLFDTPTVNLNSRTRFEERSVTTSSQIAARARQRLWLRVPFSGFERYSFSCFDELFFSFNNPKWVAPTFFEQNRAFMGISARLANNIVLDVGYLNQYISIKELNNVALLSITMSL